MTIEQGPLFSAQEQPSPHLKFFDNMIDEIDRIRLSMFELRILMTSGEVFIAISTSLPEISIVVAAVKLGRYVIAGSDIFGTNL